MGSEVNTWKYIQLRSKDHSVRKSPHNLSNLQNKRLRKWIHSWKPICWELTRI